MSGLPGHVVMGKQHSKPRWRHMAFVQGLRNLLRHFGARPGGPAHFVISDLREELVIYVNGHPYLRRELEMPAAALHHAGARSACCCAHAWLQMNRGSWSWPASQRCFSQ